MTSCQEAGVFGVVPGVIGCIQATEAIKLLLGLGKTLVGRLLILDALNMEFLEVQVKQNLRCPVCGEHPTVTELIDYELLRAPPRPRAPGGFSHPTRGKMRPHDIRRLAYAHTGQTGLPPASKW